MIFGIIIAILIAVYIFKLVISLLDYKYSKKPIPQLVKDIYNEEDYKKWVNYDRDQMRFGIINQTFSILALLLLLGFKVFGLLETWTNQISQSIYIQNLLYLGFYFVFSSVIEIPFSYYYTFVIEQRYGFNKTTKKTFWLDQLKSFLVVLVLFGALLFLLNVLYVVFIDHIWAFVLLAWVVMAVVLILMFVLNSKLFIKLFNKLTPLEEGTLKEKIDELAGHLGFEIDKISVMDASRRSTKLNAFFSGLGKHRDVVLYDTLLEKMSEDEILAVLGHELSHALHKDTTKMLIERVIVFGIYAVLAGILLSWGNLYLAFGLAGVHFGFGVIMFIALLEPLDIILDIPSNALSRVAEYRADRFGALHVSKEAMISALKVLARENFVSLNPHPVSEFLYANHPTIYKRIESILKS